MRDTMTTTIDRDSIRRIERYEMTCWPTWYAAASRKLESELGIRLVDLHGAQISISTQLDHILFNRVLGLGHEHPVTEEHLDEIISLYRAAGVPRFYIQASPAAEPDELITWLRARGFNPAEPWAKLKRGAPSVPDVETNARIDEIEPEDAAGAESFGNVVRAAFEYPASTAAWFTALVGQSGWRHYLAREAGEVVGAAALFIHGDWASLEIGVVLPEARNRGIHSALIARRIRDAAAAGCRLLTMETSAESERNRAQSFRNARRLGFELAYFRPNWELATA
jgi:GNAT superfamily N-acetyltransferase